MIGPPPAAYEFAPIAVHGRDIATVELTPGVPQEHLDASRRMIGDDAKWEEWARVRRAETSGMALITIVPTHLLVVDFVTRFPPPAAVNVTAFGADQIDAATGRVIGARAWWPPGGRVDVVGWDGAAVDRRRPTPSLTCAGTIGAPRPGPCRTPSTHSRRTTGNPS